MSEVLKSSSQGKSIPDLERSELERQRTGQWSHVE